MDDWFIIDDDMCWLGFGNLLLLTSDIFYTDNTPGIIRYPFENMLFNNPNSTLIRINKDFPDPIDENKLRTISFDENIGEIFDYWLSRII